MGLRTQASFFTAGGRGRTGGMNDQWFWYSAPSAIHRFSSAFCAPVRLLRLLGGGMSCSGSSASIRATSSLSSGFPGTMAVDCMAMSRRSSRKSALRAALSGPWQAKQFSERIGRISRLYSSLPCAWAQRSGTASRNNERTTRETMRFIVALLERHPQVQVAGAKTAGT